MHLVAFSPSLPLSTSSSARPSSPVLCRTSTIAHASQARQHPRNRTTTTGDHGVTSSSSRPNPVLSAAAAAVVALCSFAGVGNASASTSASASTTGTHRDALTSAVTTTKSRSYAHGSPSNAVTYICADNSTTTNNSQNSHSSTTTTTTTTSVSSDEQRSSSTKYHASANANSNATVLSDWTTSTSTATRRGTSLLLGSGATSSGSTTNWAFGVRPSTVGLVSVGAMTSGSVLFRRRSSSYSSSSRDTEDDLESFLHNVCTVVCMQIPFCVSERSGLIKNLEDLVRSSSCRDPGALAAACRKAAKIVEAEAGEGVFEDSRRFAPHVDVFLAQSFREAERRFASHVKTEGAHIERLVEDYRTKKLKMQKGESYFEQGDYGVVTLVVATREGVDLRCYDGNLGTGRRRDEDGPGSNMSFTNLRKLRKALHAVAKLKDGEAAGLEVLWVPGLEDDGGVSLNQMEETYPALRMN